MRVSGIFSRKWLCDAGVMLLVLLPLIWSAPAWSQEGVLRMTSRQTPGALLDRVEAWVKQRGLLVFARLDHAAGAARAGLSLRPTELLLFGHPKGGTPLMQCAQSAGIDLPLKALAWTEADGTTQLALTDPDAIARRHGLQDCAGLSALHNLVRDLMAALRAQE